MALMCPVRVSLSPPSAPAQHLARSHTLMVLSAEPVTNHSLDASKAIDLTQPRCPEMTADSSQGACQAGSGTLGGSLRGMTCLCWLSEELHRQRAHPVLVLCRR